MKILPTLLVILLLSASAAYPALAEKPEILWHGPESPSLWNGFTRITQAAFSEVPVNLTVRVEGAVGRVVADYVVRDGGGGKVEEGSLELRKSGEGRFTAPLGAFPSGYRVDYSVRVEPGGLEAEGSFEIISDDTPPKILLEDYVVGTFIPGRSSLLIEGNGTQAQYHYERYSMAIVVNDTVRYGGRTVLGSGVKEVRLYWKTGIIVHNKSMTTDEKGLRNYQFYGSIDGPFPYKFKLKFWFEAIDAAGNSAKSREFTLHVLGDDVPPIIENITITEPKPMEEITVVVFARDPDEPDDSFLSDVVILYSTDGGETWSEKPMVLTSSYTILGKPTHKWQTSLPGQPEGTLLILRIKAVDNAGNEAEELRVLRIGLPEAEVKTVTSTIVSPTTVRETQTLTTTLEKTFTSTVREVVERAPDLTPLLTASIISVIVVAAAAFMVGRRTR